MATLNLGRIKPVFRGAWTSGAFVIDDIVTHGNESFICIQAGTNKATSDASYWTKLAAKGTDGTDVGTIITTQGDLLYRDGSGLQRLAKGTAAQQLAMNAGANAPEWVTVSGGAVKQIKQTMYTGHDTYSSSTYVNIPNFAVTITPTAANSSFFIMANIQAGHSNNDSASGWNIFDSQVGTSNGNEILSNGVSAGNRSRTFQTGKYGYNSISNVDNYINAQTNISAMYTPSSNNANARTFSVAQLNPNTTTYMNYNKTDHSAGMSTVSNIIVMEIANGIFS